VETKNNKPDEVKGTGHIYDGIEELDHSPPRWFTSLFYLTIVFGVLYFIYFQVGNGTLQDEEYQIEKRADDAVVALEAAKANSAQPVSAQEIADLAKDSGKMKAAAQIYSVRCVSCHGAQGQGGIGPNLADAYWIHGGSPQQIYKVIFSGVLDKGMPNWGAILTRDEVKLTLAFISSLEGTQPAGAKAPQGELIKKE
jgi:cytochrome c oxidase cbb3-type subunit 3